MFPPGQAYGQPRTYNPQALLAAVCRHAPQFKEQQQHDAHELLHCLLDGLQVCVCVYTHGRRHRLQDGVGVLEGLQSV